jgi:ribonucleotide reductase alpha subunit
MMSLVPYESSFARNLNKEIFEHIYYFALEASNQLAKTHGPYETFHGSPLSNGKLHFENYNDVILSKDLDWNALKDEIVKYGVRNSLLVAPMPTASTSQILGNTESFEPLTSNFYVRRTLAGEFPIVNRYLFKLLKSIGRWDQTIIDHLIVSKGSVANLSILPPSLRDVYKTIWEIPQRRMIELAVDRQAFIDQSQSMNIYMNRPDMGILTKIHFFGWKKGLKTGSYYLRTRPPISSQNFTIDPEKIENTSTCESCTC